MKIGMGINDNWVSDTGCNYDQILCNLIGLASERLNGIMDNFGEPTILTALTNMMKCTSPVAKIVSLAYSINDYVTLEELRQAGLTEYMVFVRFLLVIQEHEEYADRMSRIAKNRVAIEVELSRLDTVMQQNRSQFMSEFDIAMNGKDHMASMYLSQQLEQYKRMDMVDYKWSN